MLLATSGMPDSSATTSTSTSHVMPPPSVASLISACHAKATICGVDWKLPQKLLCGEEALQIGLCARCRRVRDGQSLGEA